MHLSAEAVLQRTLCCSTGQRQSDANAALPPSTAGHLAGDAHTTPDAADFVSVLTLREALWFSLGAG